MEVAVADPSAVLDFLNSLRPPTTVQTEEDEDMSSRKKEEKPPPPYAEIMQIKGTGKLEIGFNQDMVVPSFPEEFPYDFLFELSVRSVLDGSFVTGTFGGFSDKTLAPPERRLDS